MNITAIELTHPDRKKENSTIRSRSMMPVREGDVIILHLGDVQYMLTATGESEEPFHFEYLHDDAPAGWGD